MGRRRNRLGLASAAVVPAVMAAAAVLVLADDAGPEPTAAPDGMAAHALARIADLPPVRLRPQPRALSPVVPVEGRLSVRVRRFDPLAGGIRPAPPGRISIAAAGVDAGIEPVRARSDGIEVPPEGWAGWYSGGARPGEPGRAVVIGHLDTSDGAGVFARVPSLERGARIEVTDERGDVHGYRVVGTTRVNKRRFPTNAVYGHSRNPVLVLVTCGGPYRADVGYRDNVLVYARAA